MYQEQLQLGLERVRDIRAGSCSRVWMMCQDWFGAGYCPIRLTELHKPIMLRQCFAVNWSTTDQFHSCVAIKKWCSYSFCHQYVWNTWLSLILVPQALKCVRSRLVLKIWLAREVVPVLATANGYITDKSLTYSKAYALVLFATNN